MRGCYLSLKWSVCSPSHFPTWQTCLIRMHCVALPISHHWQLSIGLRSSPVSSSSRNVKIPEFRNSLAFHKHVECCLCHSIIGHTKFPNVAIVYVLFNMNRSFGASNYSKTTKQNKGLQTKFKTITCHNIIKCIVIFLMAIAISNCFLLISKFKALKPTFKYI